MGKRLSGAIAPVGSSLIRAIKKSLTGILNASAELTPVFEGLTQKTVEGALALAGALTRKVSTTFTGDLAPTGVVTRKFWLSLSGALSA
ncbi:MAG: hypothetical protein ACXAEN_12245, partial [Candidatus Thorarchaeota archaeon]